MSEVTLILEHVQRGDSKASEELLPLVYDELRKLAAAKMAREAPGQTLQATALVHEVWLRLSRQSDARWQNRGHFFAVAAEVMRRILVDRARRRQARKHGGELERVDLDAIELPGPSDDAVVLQVHEALEQLAEQDTEKAEVVKLRFFAGLDNAEIAAILGVSEKTVQRHWSFAKAWLYRVMQQDR
jgi:RNA polymerase sigma factor (TIGR02999 family)